MLCFWNLNYKASKLGRQIWVRCYLCSINCTYFLVITTLKSHKILVQRIYNIVHKSTDWLQKETRDQCDQIKIAKCL